MKTILFWGFLVILFIGCKKSVVHNFDGQKGTDIFPNKIGDTWLYLVNDTLVNRSSEDSPFAQYNMTVSVIGSIELPGGTKANVWVYSYPAGSDTNYVFQTQDTIHFIDVNQNVYSTFVRQYIVPLQLHNSWKYSVPSFQKITVDSQSNIKVGQFNYENAFHISGYSGLPDATFEIEEWVADNVGVVKRYFNPDGMAIDPRHIISWTLVNYHLE
jgi:hypothetical protein